MNFHFAPIQGHTDLPYRFFHNQVYGNQVTYYTPFIRWEKEGLRKRDINDAFGELNNPQGVVPQIIFKNDQELSSLIGALKEKGAAHIDLNMGCPFPLQTAKGRGAATILGKEINEIVKKNIEDNPEISFSIKMRLGMNDKEEWRHILPTLNRLPLTHITLHPRIARQQYNGDVDLEQFRYFASESENPVVYNGDIRNIVDFDRIISAFPDLKNIMIGRGVLGRPSLISEITEGKEWNRNHRINKMLEFHRLLLDYYSRTLIGGEHQVLSKIKPFWEYAEEEIGRKAWKGIKKSMNMAKYHSAVAMIQ